MKIHEVFYEKGWFVSVVQGALESLFGPEWRDAELAALAIEEDLDQRDALVVSPLGLLHFYLGDRQSGQRPLRVELTPWSDAAEIRLTGTMYQGDAPGQVQWSLEGVDMRTITQTRTPQQTADFAREYIRCRAGSPRSAPG